MRARWMALLIFGSFFAGAAHADTVDTLDGAHLTGSITKITPQSIELKTDYAGTLTVKMDQVKSLATAQPLTTQFTDSTTVTGTTTLDASTFHVTSASGAASAPLEKLQASWPPGDTPPPESLFDTRHWVYQIGADINGKAGNSDERNTNLVARMALISKKDELRFYATRQYSETNNDQTADETIGGASYAAYFKPPWGWYVRGELEKDKFEDIDLRTTVAGGLAWRPINTDDRTLRFWLGLGYRNESYSNNLPDNSSGTLDSGIGHHWRWKPWLTLDNSVSYAPALDHFGNYLLQHDSSLTMPVGASRWTLGLGVHNDYNSQPAPDRDKLDTTYYSRLMMRFD